MSILPGTRASRTRRVQVHQLPCCARKDRTSKGSDRQEDPDSRSTTRLTVSQWRHGTTPTTSGKRARPNVAFRRHSFYSWGASIVSNPEQVKSYATFQAPRKMNVVVGGHVCGNPCVGAAGFDMNSLYWILIFPLACACRVLVWGPLQPSSSLHSKWYLLSLNSVVKRQGEGGKCAAGAAHSEGIQLVPEMRRQQGYQVVLLALTVGLLVDLRYHIPSSWPQHQS